jgi:hypothetical protein
MSFTGTSSTWKGISRGGGGGGGGVQGPQVQLLTMGSWHFLPGTPWVLVSEGRLGTYVYCVPHGSALWQLSQAHCRCCYNRLQRTSHTRDVQWLICTAPSQLIHRRPQCGTWCQCEPPLVAAIGMRGRYLPDCGASTTSCQPLPLCLMAVGMTCGICRQQQQPALGLCTTRTPFQLLVEPAAAALHPPQGLSS